MNSNDLKKKILSKDYDELLLDLYIDENLVPYNRDRYVKAIEEFEKLYGEDDICIFSAPGRSEVCGNHTDHQHGRVLACAINLDAIAVVAKNEGFVAIKSDDMYVKEVAVNELEKVDLEAGTTEGLVRGVLADIKKKGYQVEGFKAFITSDVLIGAGMSSSAAFETLIGVIISGLYNDNKINPIDIAKIGQFSENVYFEKPCGLMDQMASSVGSLITIDFNNVEVPLIEKIEFDLKYHNHSLCIVNTLGSHADLTPDYAAVPGEMKQVAAYFNQEVLGDVDEEDFYRELPNIRKVVGDRPVLRAIHLYDENKRVIQAVEALKENNINLFKEVIRASGNSSFKFLQNVYSPSQYNQQAVSLGLAISERLIGNQGVCRVHGGGFAGTIQVFLPSDLVADYKIEIEKVFGQGTCQVLGIRKFGGIQVI